MKKCSKLFLIALPFSVTLSASANLTQPTVVHSMTVSVESPTPTVEKNEVVETEIAAPEYATSDITEDELAYQIAQEDYMGELELLAALVEAEAGNQDLKGKRLVADVVLNRVDSDRFPNSITDVIYQKYHFSTAWDGSLDKAMWNISDDSFAAVRLEALENDERLDKDVLFFTAGGYNKWCIPGYKYGAHYFGY